PSFLTRNPGRGGVSLPSLHFGPASRSIRPGGGNLHGNSCNSRRWASVSCSTVARSQSWHLDGRTFVRGSWVLVALMVALPATARAETVREQSRRTVEIPGISRIVAQNSRGRIGVTASADRSLHITALKIVRASSEDAARRLADDTIVELRRDGSEYEIQVG